MTLQYLKNCFKNKLYKTKNLKQGANCHFVVRMKTCLNFMQTLIKYMLQKSQIKGIIQAVTIQTFYSFIFYL